MKIIKKVKKEVEEIENVFCNKCGQSLKLSDDGSYEGPGFHGLNEAQAYFGYGSKFDGDTLTFSLCEKCTFTLVMSFKIPPEYRGLISSENTIKDLYKDVEKIYGLKIENVKSENNSDFLNKRQLKLFKENLEKEVELIDNSGVEAILKKINY